MSRRGGHAGPRFYRPDQDPVNAGYPGSWVYLVCLDPPIEHPELGPHASASHYTGTAWDIAARMAEHGTTEGARLLQVQRERGGTWHITRTWKGGRWEERGIKDWRNAPFLCPRCSPGNHRGRDADVARAADRAREDWERKYSARSGPAPDVPLSRLPAPPPAERGRRAGERFLATREGWSADRIAAALEYVTGPYREHGRHTEAAAHEMAAFTATVTAGIEAQRATERAQAAPATQPKETPEVSTDTAHDRPAGVETQPATEWMKGAQTAHDLIVGQVEAGQDADAIAARWDEALATYDDATATTAEREWHAGADETARDMIQTWRDMQREEAEQAQAARDEREATQEPEPWQLTEREMDALDAGRQERERSQEREPELEAAS